MSLFAPRPVSNIFSRRILFIFFAQILVSAKVFAFVIDIHIGGIKAETWQSNDVHLNIKDRGQGLKTDLSVPSVELDHDGSKDEIRDVRLSCLELMFSNQRLSCEEGRLMANTSLVDKVNLDFALDYQGAEDWQLKIRQLDLSGARAQGQVRMLGQDWWGRLSTSAITFDWFLKHLHKNFTLPPGWSLSGKLVSELDFSGSGTEPGAIKGVMKVKEGHFSDADGLQVGESLSLQLDLAAVYKQHGWHGNIKLDLLAGQAYVDPLYLDFGETGILLKSQFDYQPVNEKLVLSKSVLEWQDVMQAGFELESDLTSLTINSLTADITSGRLDSLYTKALQSFVIGRAVDNLEVSGSTKASIRMDNMGLSAVDLHLTDLYLDDLEGGFGLYDVDADLHWRRGALESPSVISIGGGHLLRIDFGDFAFKAVAFDDRFTLIEPISVPVLDGVFNIYQLNGTHLGSKASEWLISAEMNQLSLPSLSASFEWPLMQGDLSGHFKQMRIREKELVMGGDIKANAFDGDLTITGLSIKNVFEPVPSLKADVKLTDLDLLKLTNTFSFGRIEGSLNGEVDNLELVGWSPVNFSAHIYSPENDDKRHRISQRAVDNLTAIGNGVTGAISGSFLSIFENFSYDLIDLSINLQGDTAILGGIDHDSGGFYLVKGAGLPRIDVIGRNRRVAWKDLVSRLSQIQVEGAIIK